MVLICEEMPVKKGGKNVACANVSALLEFLYPDGRPDEPTIDDYAELTRLTFLLSDFTTSNSGKVNGSAAIIRRSIHKLSGHLLVFNAPCLSHVARLMHCVIRTSVYAYASLIVFILHEKSKVNNEIRVAN